MFHSFGKEVICSKERDKMQSRILIGVCGKFSPLSFMHLLNTHKAKNSKGLGPYSQHFIFFVTYELVQLARVFISSKPWQPDVM
jgi:hypothetical protein